MRRIAIAVLLTSATAHADVTASAKDGRDTSRLSIGAGIAGFMALPESMSADPTLGLVVAKPLWLGERHRYHQWAVDLSGLAGYMSSTDHGYLLLGPTAGINLYFGSVFGFELREGVSGMMQLGARTAAAAVLGGSGAYVFRLWADDRKRVKLQLTMNMGFYFAKTEPSDFAFSAGGGAVSVAYEAPL
jgi:hypothetical protein